MLNAYNNDIEYKSRWFHIQTEDNGVKIGRITTTVFHSGQTLDCKSTSYQEAIVGLTAEADINKVVKERMVEQHQFFYKKLFEGDYDAKVAAMYAKSNSPKISTNAQPVPAASARVAPAPAPRSSSPVIAPAKIVSPKITPAAQNRPHIAEMATPIAISAAVQADAQTKRRKAYNGIQWPNDDLALDSLVAILIEANAS